MFYKVEDGHGLPHDPFKAIVAPRPIGWISTQSADGKINLAPYSFFNAVCAAPPIVMFASDGWKDSVANIAETKVFCCNFVGAEHFKAMSISSKPVAHGESEFELAKLDAEPCSLIKAPRVAGAPAALECRMTQIVQQKDLSGKETNSWVVFGQVVGVHISDDYIANGRFDLSAAKPVSRLGYQDYAIIEDLISLARPSKT